MPPKFDPSEAKIIFLRACGGTAPAPATLAPKVGPLGMSPKMIGDKVAAGTKDWAGINVTVKVTVINRQPTVEVVASSSALIVRALKQNGQSNDGDLSLGDVIEIAREMRARSLARELSGTVKEILGTCRSIGCTVDGNSAEDMTAMVSAGEVEIPQE
eukprot:TRINITY_DN58_c0_g1_i14.p1 TRINITY_DN58_c0_g1~~TRINITY_DN58_c0_g1_i14.p1  ORF type:complete len:158 (+),score=45.52 TRINITY_DN58_c0_g1_i14:71-544(+)